jgi:hypothetical protein
LMVEEVVEDAPHCDIAQQEPDHAVSASGLATFDEAQKSGKVGLSTKRTRPTGKG